MATKTREEKLQIKNEELQEKIFLLEASNNQLSARNKELGENNVELDKKMETLEAQFAELNGILFGGKNPIALSGLLKDSVLKHPMAEGRLILEQVNAHVLDVWEEDLRQREKRFRYSSNNVNGLKTWLGRLSGDGASVIIPRN